MLFRHGRCKDTRAEKSQYGGYQGKGYETEMIVRKYLFSHGLRFRVQVRKLPGNPDIVLPKYKTVIFVNGCFWHGHEGCKYFRLPKSNVEFWTEKIEHNIEGDSRNRTRVKSQYKQRICVLGILNAF